MKYSVAKAEKGTINITFTFNKEEWEKALNQGYLKSRNKFRVDGFRKGKAPRHVIERLYGPSIFYEEALNTLYMQNYYTVLEKERENYIVVSSPSLSVDKLEEDEVVLIANVAVKPEVNLGAYTGINIEKVEYNVTDKDVEAQLNQLQERNARQIELDAKAKAKKGDTAVIDFSGSVDGVKFEGGTAENYSLVLGSKTFIPGFEEQVIGMKSGEEKEVVVTFPEDYQAEELKGKQAIFAVKVHKILRKELPEVNDAFIKDAVGAESVAAYTATLRENLEKDAKARADSATEDNLIKTIAANTIIDIPEAMIDSQIETMLNTMRQRLAQTYGPDLKFEDYLRFMGTNIDDYKKDQRTQAKEIVHSQLVIEAIIKKEGFKAEEGELEAKIASNAKELNITVEEYEKKINAGQKEYIANNIVIEKLFNFLKANNTFILKSNAKEKTDSSTKTTTKKTVKKDSTAEEKTEKKENTAKKTVKKASVAEEKTEKKESTAKKTVKKASVAEEKTEKKESAVKKTVKKVSTAEEKAVKKESAVEENRIQEQTSAQKIPTNKRITEAKATSRRESIRKSASKKAENIHKK